VLRQQGVFGLLFWGLICWQTAGNQALPSRAAQDTNVLTFAVRGVVKDIKANESTIVVQHEAISNYMDAMTMPFKVKEAQLLTPLRKGDRISFQLQVTSTESWISQIDKIAGTPVEDQTRPAGSSANQAAGAVSRHPLLDFKFTNELGQAVSLSDFQGQALGITFFFTRCPIPDYCPRLSKNFQEACQKLSAIPGGPTNWHFLSVSFDTKFDTVPVLRAYGEFYHYDPAHWSFITGPAEQIGELARLSDVKFDPDGGFFNHNFRTLIIDAGGHLQMSFPIGGNLSDAIVEEIRKATAVTNSVSVLGLPVSQEAHGP
jgi:protein SCO1/2